MQDRFSGHLHELAEPIWRAQHEHPFVRGIGDGTLDPQKLRHYVRQEHTGWSGARSRSPSPSGYRAEPVLRLTRKAKKSTPGRNETKANAFSKQVQQPCQR